MITWPIRILHGASPGYDLSFGTSLAKVVQLGSKNNCDSLADNTPIYLKKEGLVQEIRFNKCRR